MKRVFYFAILTLLFVACRQHKDISKETNMIKNSGTIKASQPVVIYKTNGDFNDYVPVIMNAERTKIVSYPAPTDLSVRSKPTELKNGYLLDNRGITENVVFLNYTYEAYMSMKNAPALAELIKNIKNKYPLKELIYCGSRYQYKDEVNELNKLIECGFQGCKKADLISMGVTLDL